ncbi:Ger(x)C family spore germination protein [Priestia koreensis]|uniref:Ger(x)C family spore germination protein n=1 Tax=Priestia koreensis TaxID=284581 RepID=UPI0020414881|nr:Ger(x)C family spore germination protein [Priestia koreensis]MCM3006233.1 Ger(x)C family spore germination protein [Priestia koreensis]
MKKARLILLPFSLLLLTGCWDQHLLKDTKLIYAVGMDLVKDEDKVKITTSIPSIMTASGQGPPQLESVVYSSIGPSVRGSRNNLDRTISEQINTSKNRVVLVSKEIAKKDLYAYLDVYYRDPMSNLAAKIIVVDGKASEFLEITPKSEPITSKYISDLITSAEDVSMIPEMNIQYLCSRLFDPGSDALVPYLVKMPGNEMLKIEGLAMFNETKYKGYLRSDESMLFTHLADENSTMNGRITKKVFKDSTTKINDYVTVNIEKSKRQLDIHFTTDHEVSVDVTLNLEVSLIEYPRQHVMNQSGIADMNARLTKVFTKDAKKVIVKLQQADCDGLGVGRRIMAFYPDQWKKLNWEKDYPRVRFHTKVNVSVVESGILS